MAVLMIISIVMVCQVLLTESQESQVYIGTGVNGITVNKAGDDIVILGGLLVVHLIEDGKCTDILDPSVQRIEAVALTTQKINDNPSFLPGVTLGFEIRETCTQANRALEQSLRFVTGRDLEINGTTLGISGVVGATVSRVSTTVARLLRLFKVPQISYASTASSLSDKTVFDYFLRTIPSDTLQARTMADIVDYFNWTYVIAMHTGDVYGREGIKAFINELEKWNSTERCIAMSSIELALDATDANFDAAVEKINQQWVRNSTVIVLFAQLASANGLFAAVHRKEMSDPKFASRNLTWIGGDGWSDRVPEELLDTAKGLLGVIPRSYLSEEFNEYFGSLKPPNNTDNPWFHEYWEEFFNCSLESPPARGLSECNLENQTISPETGFRQSAKVPFTMDAVYAFAHAIRQLQKDFCQGGPGLCSEIIDTRSGGVAIRGDLLLKYLQNVSFTGVSTELINFDENGDQQGGYVVKNLQKKSNGEFIYEVIGQWDEVPLNRSSRLEMFGDIQWSHGGSNVPESICSQPCGNGEYPEPLADQAECCWVCKPCTGDNVVSSGLVCTPCERGYAANEMKTECTLIQPSFLTWSHGWSIFMILLSLFGIIATATVAIIFIVHYKHRLIKASSRELSAILLTGIMLCYLLPFFFIAMPSPAICAIRRFGVGFCFSLCYSALLVKTNRIHRIFNRSPDSTQVPHLISPQSQVFFTALLVAVQVVIATVWLIAETPSISYVYSTFSTELKCGESPYIGLSITLAYNCLLLVITTYFAFRTRKVPQNFNEAKFISFTMYTLCILWLAFIPTYFATTTLLGTFYQAGSLMLAIILNASVTLCILFVPKLYYLFAGKKDDSPFGTKSTPMATLTMLPPTSTAQSSSIDAKSTVSATETKNGVDIANSSALSFRNTSKYADAATQT